MNSIDWFKTDTELVLRRRRVPRTQAVQQLLIRTLDGMSLDFWTVPVLREREPVWLTLGRDWANVGGDLARASYRVRAAHERAEELYRAIDIDYSQPREFRGEEPSRAEGAAPSAPKTPRAERRRVVRR